MLEFADWFPLAVVGVGFTTLAVFKLYGLRHGIVGGKSKPAFQQLCGT
jgi:hypothetical protein